MYLRNCVRTALFGALLLVAPQVHAQFGGLSVPGLGGGGGGGGDLVKKQTEILGSMNKALSKFFESQGKIGEATKNEALILGAKNAIQLIKDGGMAKNGSEINVLTKEGLAGIAKLNEGMVQLDAQGKKKIAEAIPPYLEGMIGIVAAAKLAVDAGKEISKVKDPMVLTQISGLITFAEAAPELLTGAGTTTNALISYATKNDVDTKGLKDGAKGLM